MSNLNKQQFKDYTLTFKPSKYKEYDDDTDLPPHKIVATHKGKNVGHLEWHPFGSEIAGVGINEEHRRKGVATAMFNMANELTKGALHHSSTITPEGEAWARGMGHEVPKE